MELSPSGNVLLLNKRNFYINYLDNRNRELPGWDFHKDYIGSFLWRILSKGYVSWEYDDNLYISLLIMDSNVPFWFYVNTQLKTKVYTDNLNQ